MGIERGRLVGILLVAFAATLWSTAGLFVRTIDLDVWQTLGWRALFGGLSLYAAIGLGIGADRGTGRRTGKPLGRLGWAAVLVSALAMTGFIAALRATSVANVMACFATTPFLAAGIAWAWLGEAPTRRLVLAALVSFVGVLVTVSFALEPKDLIGILLALGMSTGFALLLVLMRRAPDIPVMPVNAHASALVALACLPAMVGTLPSPATLGLLALFGFLTITVAYGCFLLGGRLVPSGEAGLIGLIDVVLGPVWVWVAFAERPSLGALLGGALVVVSTAWYLSGDLGRRRPAAVPEPAS